jgi:hypothetical protein
MIDPIRDADAYDRIQKWLDRDRSPEEHLKQIWHEAFEAKNLLAAIEAHQKMQTSYLKTISMNTGFLAAAILFMAIKYIFIS